MGFLIDYNLMCDNAFDFSYFVHFDSVFTSVYSLITCDNLVLSDNNNYPGLYTNLDNYLFYKFHSGIVFPYNFYAHSSRCVSQFYNGTYSYDWNNFDQISGVNFIFFDSTFINYTLYYDFVNFVWLADYENIWSSSFIFSTVSEESFDLATYWFKKLDQGLVSNFMSIFLNKSSFRDSYKFFFFYDALFNTLKINSLVFNNSWSHSLSLSENQSFSVFSDRSFVISDNRLRIDTLFDCHLGVHRGKTRLDDVYRVISTIRPGRRFLVIGRRPPKLYYPVWWLSRKATNPLPIFIKFITPHFYFGHNIENIFSIANFNNSTIYPFFSCGGLNPQPFFSMKFLLNSSNNFYSYRYWLIFLLYFFSLIVFIVYGFLVLFFILVFSFLYLKDHTYIKKYLIWSLIWIISLCFMRLIFYILFRQFLLKKQNNDFTDRFSELSYNIFLQARATAGVNDALIEGFVGPIVERQFTNEAELYPDISNVYFFYFQRRGWDDSEIVDPNPFLFTKAFSEFAYPFDTRFTLKRFGFIDEKLVVSYFFVYLFYKIFYFSINLLPDESRKALIKLESDIIKVIVRLSRSSQVRKKINIFFLFSRLSLFLLEQFKLYNNRVSSKHSILLFINNIFNSIILWRFFFQMIVWKTFNDFLLSFFLFKLKFFWFFFKSINLYSFPYYSYIKILFSNLRVISAISSSLRMYFFTPLFIKERTEYDLIFDPDPYRAAVLAWYEATIDILFYELHVYRDWEARQHLKISKEEESILKFLSSFKSASSFLNHSRFSDVNNRWTDFVKPPELQEVFSFLKGYQGVPLPLEHPIYEKGYLDDWRIDPLIEKDFLDSSFRNRGSGFWDRSRFSFYDFLYKPRENAWTNFLGFLNFFKKDYFSFIFYLFLKISNYFFFLLVYFLNFFVFLIRFLGIYWFIKFFMFFFSYVISKSVSSFISLKKIYSKKFVFLKALQFHFQFDKFFFSLVVSMFRFFFSMVRFIIRFILSKRFIFFLLSFIIFSFLNLYSYCFCILIDIFNYLVVDAGMDVSLDRFYKWWFLGPYISKSNLESLFVFYSQERDVIPSGVFTFLNEEFGLWDGLPFFLEYYEYNLKTLPFMLLVTLKWDFLPFPILAWLSGASTFHVIFWTFHYYFIYCVFIHSLILFNIFKIIWFILVILFNILLYFPLEYLLNGVLLSSLALLKIFSGDVYFCISILYFGLWDFFFTDMFYFLIPALEFCTNYDISFLIWKVRQSMLYSYFFPVKGYYFMIDSVYYVNFSSFLYKLLDFYINYDFSHYTYNESLKFFNILYLRAWDFFNLICQSSDFDLVYVPYDYFEMNMIFYHKLFEWFATDVDTFAFIIASHKTNIIYLSELERFGIFEYSVLSWFVFTLFFILFVLFFIWYFLPSAFFFFFFFSASDCSSNVNHNMAVFQNTKGKDIEWVFMDVLKTGVYTSFMRRFMRNIYSLFYKSPIKLSQNDFRPYTYSGIYFSNSFRNLRDFPVKASRDELFLFKEFLNHAKRVNPDFYFKFGAWRADIFEHMSHDQYTSRLDFIIEKNKKISEEDSYEKFLELSQGRVDNFEAIVGTPTPDSTGYVEDMGWHYRPAWGSREAFNPDFQMWQEEGAVGKRFVNHVDKEDEIWDNLCAYFSRIDIDLFSNNLSYSVLHKDRLPYAYKGENDVRHFYQFYHNGARNVLIWFLFISFFIFTYWIKYVQFPELDIIIDIVFVIYSDFYISSLINWFPFLDYIFELCKSASLFWAIDFMTHFSPITEPMAELDFPNFLGSMIWLEFIQSEEYYDIEYLFYELPLSFLDVFHIDDDTEDVLVMEEDVDFFEDDQWFYNVFEVNPYLPFWRETSFIKEVKAPYFNCNITLTHFFWYLYRYFYESIIFGKPGFSLVISNFVILDLNNGYFVSDWFMFFDHIFNSVFVYEGFYDLVDFIVSCCYYGYYEFDEFYFLFVLFLFVYLVYWNKNWFFSSSRAFFIFYKITKFCNFIFGLFYEFDFFKLKFLIKKSRQRSRLFVQSEKDFFYRLDFFFYYKKKIKTYLFNRKRFF